MRAGSGWDSRRGRRRLSNQDLVVIVIVAAILAVAIGRGISDHRLSIATLVFIGVLIPTIIFHEVSHGVVAYWCGDDTAKRAGRISANPVRHIDPIGSIIVPVALVLIGGPGFGWARPVPVTLNRLRHPRNQAILVALAGPAANGLVAALAGVGIHFLVEANRREGLLGLVSVLYRTSTSGGLIYWATLIVGFLGLVNIFLGAFNLLPIPPLDGSALLERFIPVQALPTYYRIRMLFIVVVILIVVLDQGLLGTMYGDITTWYFNLILR